MYQILFCIFYILSYSVLAVDGIFDSLTYDDDVSSNDIFTVAEESHKYGEYAKLVLINKMTTKSLEIDVKVGQSIIFGNAEILLQKCFVDDVKKDRADKAFIKVDEYKLDDDARTIFNGWLVSNHLSVSTLEHPVYSVILRECLVNSNAH